MPRIQSNLKPSIDMVVEFLSTKDYGSKFSYSELNEISNTNFKFISGNVKKLLLKGYNKLLTNIRGQGYQICSIDNTHIFCAQHRKKSLNQLKKAATICTHSNIQEMSEDAKWKLFQESAKTNASIVVHKLTEKQSKIIGNQVCLPSNEQILAMFIKKMN